MEDFDFIVIGAGTGAMGFLHGMLSPGDKKMMMMKERKKALRVCVLERGSHTPTEGKTSNPPLKEWYIQARSAVQYSARFQGSHHYDIPTGQGRGGTTNIHAGLCFWPPPSDFEKDWPLGFRKSVQQINQSLQSSIQSSISEADPIKKDHTTTIHFPSTINQVPCTSNAQGKRINYYQALVEPFLSQTDGADHIQITWIDQATVQRILVKDDPIVDTKQATGVLYIQEGQPQPKRIHGNTIVLTAGVLESPRLLVQSGLIPPTTTFPLWDHVVVPCAMLHPPTFFSKSKLSHNGVAALHHLQCGEHSYQVTRFDADLYPFILPALAADFLLRRWNQTKWILVDLLANGLESLLRIVTTVLFSIPLVNSCLTVWGINSMGPARCVGTLRVVTEPDGKRDELNIDLQYLNSPQDLWALESQAWPVLQRLVWGLEIFPGAWIRRWCFRAWAQTFCLPYFHWCGTMSEWLDPKTLACRSTSNIRVCDASAFPSLPRAPTAPACAALGYHLASMLMEMEKME